jgi:GLPGLI family protein
MRYLKVLALLLFFANPAFAQISEGTINYRVVFGSDEIYDRMSKEIRDVYVLEEEAKKYVLEFNKKEFCFYLLPGLTPDGRAYTEEYYYKERDSAYSLRPAYYSMFGKLLVKQTRDTKWEMHNESKKIGDYTCYKATATLVRVNPAGTFKFPIIAWYCPKIPLPYGPLGYSGLPGLILELQERNLVYGAEKINFTVDKKTSKLKKPDSKGRRIIANDALNEMIEKYMKDLVPK